MNNEIHAPAASTPRKKSLDAHWIKIRMCYRADLDNLEIDISPAVPGIEPRLAHNLGTAETKLTRRQDVLRWLEITLVAGYSKRRPKSRSNKQPNLFL
jgi:hypothetical protein